MSSYREHFGPFDGHVWLNCAHQGPLPRAAVQAAEVALTEKREPYRLTEATFEETPRRLKRALGRLVDVPADEVILGNSTAYGLNLLVQGLPLRAGDEVLLVDGDFPSTVVTWLPLRRRGVDVRLARPPEWPPSPEWIEDQIGPRTRVFCCSWVFSFFGSAVDLEAAGSVCGDRDVLFVVNGSQGLGARPLSLAGAPYAAVVSCGFKWQCGPYGTGFAWIRPDVLESLEYEQAYWLARGASRSSNYEIRDDAGPAAFDVFGTANFLSFRAWTASVELLLDIGVDEIAAHDDVLVERVAAGLVDLGFVLVSPRSGASRTTLVLFSHPDASRNGAIKASLDEQGVHVAERDGKLRISPHLYNTEEDVDRALDVLRGLV